MIKKIIIGTLVLVVLLIGFILCIPFVFKDKFQASIKQEINNQLNAQVDYKNPQLSILQSFPDLYLNLEDVIIINNAPFEGDTLARVQELGFGINIMSIFKGSEIDINAIALKNGAIKAITLMDESSMAVSNFDIFPTNDEGEIENQSEQLSLQIEDIDIENLSIFYESEIDQFQLIADNLNTKGSAKYNGDKIATKAAISSSFFQMVTGTAVLTSNNLAILGDVTILEELYDWEIELSGDDFIAKDGESDIHTNDLRLESNGKLAGAQLTLGASLSGSDFNYIEDQTAYLKQAEVLLLTDIVGDLELLSFDLNNNSININQLEVNVDGNVQLPNDGIDLDLDFKSNQSTFKELLSLIPPEFLKDFDSIEADGEFSINGSIDGRTGGNYSPAILANIDIKDASFKYPDLPTKISDINLLATVKSEANQSTSLSADIPDARLKVNDEPVQVSFYGKQLFGDPDIDASIKGKLDLQEIKNLFPTEDISELSGIVNTDVHFDGLWSDVENEQYQNIGLDGELDMANLRYNDKDMPAPLEIKTAQLKFAPEKADVSNLDATIGSSDIKGSGEIENIVNYLFSDGLLKGNLNVQSNYLNIDELSTSEDDTEEDSGSFVRLPKQLALDLNADIKKLDFDGLTLSNLKGDLSIIDEVLILNDLKANMLGGNVALNGNYNAKGDATPKADINLTLNQFDIQETFQYLNPIAKIAPLAKYLDGKFNTEISLNSEITPDLSFDMATLTGMSNLRIPLATVQDMPILTKSLQIANISGQNAKPTIKDAWTILKFDDGKVNVEPFNIDAGDIDFAVSGSNGFDQSINYKIAMTVPSDKFGGAAGIANDFLSKQKIPLLNLSVPQQIVFHLNVGGTLANPNVSIAKVTADKGENGIGNAIKDELDAAKDKAKAEAQAALDKAKSEAEKAKQDALDAAKAAADKAKQDAIDKAKEEAEKAKDDIKDRIKDGLGGFGFGK